MAGRQGRHGARRLLLQALYQHQVAGHSAGELLDQFAERPQFAGIDAAYFRELLGEILSSKAELDARIASCADRPLTQLDPVEHAVLWIGMAELTRRDDVPPRVVINEAVELAKEFGAQDSYRYINAILDGVVGTSR